MDLSREIAAMLEARKEDLDSRNSDMTKASFIMALFDLVNPAYDGPGASSLNINLAVLSIIAYSVMVINADPENIDYSLPKPWTRYGIGVYRMTITRRSLGTTLAFQEQRNVIQDPVSFTYQNRIDTPMDVFVAPKEVAEYYGKNPEYT